MAWLSERSSVSRRAVLAAGLGLIGCSRYSTPVQDVSSAPSAGRLLAGVARADITPETPIPLAGYGERFLKLSRGVHDRVAASAIVFRRGRSRLALVSVDLCGVSEELRLATVDRVRRGGIFLAEDELLLAATHTHAGPGGYVDKGLFVSAAGLFQPEWFETLADRMAQAVIEAAERQVPVRQGVGRTQVPEFQRNRRNEPYADATMRVIRVDDASGRTLAAMVHYAGHPTILQGTDMQISRGWPGGLVDEVERAIPGSLCLFLNGAAGDLSVGPTPEVADAHPDRYEQAMAVGRALGVRAANVARDIEPQPDEVFAARGVRLAEMRPLRMPALLPTRRPLVHDIRLGSVRLVSVPGEMTCVHGRLLCERLAPAREADVAVLGFANDYLGYFPTSAQVEAGGYEAGMSFYGTELVDATVRALASPREGRRKGA